MKEPCASADCRQNSVLVDHFLRSKEEGTIGGEKKQPIRASYTYMEATGIIAFERDNRLSARRKFDLVLRPETGNDLDGVCARHGELGLRRSSVVARLTLRGRIKKKEARREEKGLGRCLSHSTLLSLCM